MSLRMSKYERFRTGSISSPENPFTTVRRRNYSRLSYLILQSNQNHILCTDKDNVSAEYALGGLSNNIFASTYIYVIPEKEKLIAQVEAVLEKWEDKEE